MVGVIAVQRQVDGDVVQEMIGLAPGQFLNKPGVMLYEWTGPVWPAGLGPAVCVGDFAEWEATKTAAGYVFRPMPI
ncbi:MAG TPA: hypothetical protein VF170_09790 [Planctomycetaceae bacterium]